jgi:hypothetical protein
MPSPLLEDYNNSGIVTPALQRALDIARQKLPQFQLPGAQSPAATPRFTPPGMQVPPITRTATNSPPKLGGVTAPPEAPAPALTMPRELAAASLDTAGSRTPAMPTTPRITNPQDTTDLTELNRRKNTGSGISQIHNPVARGLLRGLNVAGSIIAPRIMPAIPGTEEHHNYLVKQAEGTVDKDVARAKENASTAETEQRTAAAPTPEEAAAARAAETRERNAQAQNLEHPRPKDLTEAYLRDNPNATAADLAAFLQKDYETREDARAKAEAAARQPNEYADFKTGFLKKNPNATPDEVTAAYNKSKKTATETSAEDDQKYEALIAKRNLNQKLTPEEEAQVKAYEHRKTLGQQVTNVYANERADKTELNKQATTLHKQLMTEFSTVQTQMDNLAQAREDLKANPVGQNLGSIKTLVALAGGRGSGVRITQAELNSLAANLGLKATFNNWLSSIEGKGKFDTATLNQINQVLDGVEKIARDKQAKLNSALDSLQDAKSKDDINKIERDYRHGVSQSGEQIPTVKTKDEYDKLPSGTIYVDGNGVKGKKP